MDHRQPKFQPWDDDKGKNILRVCMGIFTTGLGSNKTVKYFIKNSLSHCSFILLTL